LSLDAERANITLGQFADVTLWRSAANTLSIAGTARFKTRADFPGRMSQTGSYGTILPAAPADGELAGLVDSLQYPSFQWRFRYSMQSYYSFRWEFVGGPPLIASVLSSTNIPTNNQWSGASPLIYFPAQGTYAVTVSQTFSCYYPGSVNYAYSLLLSRQGPENPAIFGQSLRCPSIAAVGDWLSMPLSFTTVVNAGTNESAVLRYQSQPLSTGYVAVSVRQLQVIPIRLM